MLLGQHRRNRFASCKLAAAISYKELREPGTQVVEFGDGAVRTWRDVELAKDNKKSGARPTTKGHNVDIHKSWRQMNAAPEAAPDTLRVKTHDELFGKAGGGERRNVAETLEVTRGALEETLEEVEQKQRPRTTLLESSVESSRPSNLSEYYPSQRPSSAKAKAILSLISPRTRKKIRHLSPPGQIDRDILQVNKFNKLVNVHP